MQRSTSNSRISKDLFKTTSDSDAEQQNQQLPTYDPLSYVAKKHNSQLKSAENAIHLIPFLLVLCAVILWFFSNTESRI